MFQQYGLGKCEGLVWKDNFTCELNSVREIELDDELALKIVETSDLLDDTDDLLMLEDVVGEWFERYHKVA